MSSIFVIGTNHHRAPIALREQIYFASEKLPLYLQDIMGRGCAKEAVLLSTCNRSELYAKADDVDILCNWFCAQTPLSREQLDPILYIYCQEKAISHLLEVACGLDSMVLGEPQILGQVKAAFSESCSVGAVGTMFYSLFQQVFSIAKDIRTTTAIGACPVSIASAAVHFAREVVPAFDSTTVALVGAGDTAELLLRYLKDRLKTSIVLVNRNQGKALALAKEVGGVAYSMDHLQDVLAMADIVFSATGSATPVISKTMVMKAMQGRNQRPLTLIDIAMPRDIEPGAAEVAGTQLFCIDDLKAIIEKNRIGREHAGSKAREMIQKKAMECMVGLQSQDKAAHTIRAYRGQIEDICQMELLKAKQQLQQGEDPVHVLEWFAHAFIEKLLHVPSVQLRQAGVEGRVEFLRYAKQLFAISDPDIERL